MEAVGIDSDFWNGRRVLVTGHTGFKGSWLTLWLQLLGAKVVGYALNPPTEPSLHELARVSEGIVSVTGDVRDLERLSAVVLEHKPEIVFHLAAQAMVRASYSDPVSTYSTNVLGTVNLLEALRRTGCSRAVVNVTSDKCYENRETQKPYREDEPLGGFDPYSSSKACAEIVTNAYRSSYFDSVETALASVRAGNVIGGGDWAKDRLVPDLVRAFTAKAPVTIRYPDAVRPWQHVLDPLCGYLLLAQALWRDGKRFAEAWNFGPDDNDACRVATVVERAVVQWGPGAAWKKDEAVHPHEAGLLRLDSSKARTRLNWHPRWHVGEALRHTMEWYKRYAAGSDMRAFSLDQIARYAGRP